MIEKNIKIGIHTIHYKEFGDASNQTFILLHGWWYNSSDWIEFGELLEKNNYHVIIPDLPGFGKSTLITGLTLDAMSELFEKFIQILDLNNISLWGHRSGGTIASCIASRNNVSIKHLILHDIAKVRSERIRSRNSIFRKKTLFMENIPVLKSLRVLMLKYIYDDALCAVIQRPNLAGTYGSIIESRFVKILPEIRQKVMLVWNKNYFKVNQKHIDQIQELLQDSCLHILPKGKYNQLQRAEFFLKYYQDCFKN